MNDRNNAVRLLDAGFSAEEVVEIASEAVQAYDDNRKPSGASSGALGYVAREIYRHLGQTDEYDPDMDAFGSPRPLTGDDLADRLKRSRGAISSAMNKLVAHGFIERRRDGRHFTIRLLLPEIALTEAGEDWLETDWPTGSLGADRLAPLGARILSLFPRPPHVPRVVRGVEMPISDVNSSPVNHT